jgi:glycerate 2-kinase
MPDRDLLRRILDAALAAVEPRAATERALDRYRDVLELPGRVWIVAAGKAAAGMADGALERLADQVAGGTVAIPAGGAAPSRPGLVVWEADHPVPGAHSLAAGAEALAVARAAAHGELVLCLLSGGASALWAAPAADLSLAELAAATSAMLRAGLPIVEMNTVRKHLSRIGGGGLARAAAPARVATLAISDVLGSALDAIGSGPAVPDPTGFAGALAFAPSGGVMPPAGMRYLQAGAAGERPETPKPGDGCFAGSSAFVIADNRDALAGAAAAAEAWGYEPEVIAEPLVGDARDAAARIAALVRARQGGATRALILGGETTVAVRGDGRGGRNQELALALALELDGEPGWRAATLGTDGVDGPTPAAGACVDGGTVARGSAVGVDAAAALVRNDSHGFFRQEGGLVVTGPTGTNVADLAVVLIDGETVRR